MLHDPRKSPRCGGWPFNNQQKKQRKKQKTNKTPLNIRGVYLKMSNILIIGR